MSARWAPSPRRRRRNLLLLAGLVPSVVAVAVAAALALMLVRQSTGVAATQAGEHGEARQHFAANRWFGTVERWIAPYNEGVATFREGNYAAALADFQAALLEVPPEHECLVLHNIAVTRGRLGDLEADGAGDAGAAMDQYRAGREVLADGPCLQSEVRADGGGVSAADDPDDVGADSGQPQDLTQSLPTATRQLDAQLVDKIRALLEARDQLDRAALTPEELAAVERLERQEQRAERREQRLQDRAPDAEADQSQNEPEDPTQDDRDDPSEDDSEPEDSDEDVYGW